MNSPLRPLSFALHRLCRTDPRRAAAVAARDRGLPVVPARAPRLRAGRPGRAGLTPFQRKRHRRAGSRAKRSRITRLRAALAEVFAAARQKRERREAELRDEHLQQARAAPGR